MSAKQKHMLYDELYIIETDLNNGESFKSIAKHIQKDCTTISKCVRNNYITVRKGVYGRPFNNCLNRNKCKKTAICNICYRNPGKSCRGCPECFSHCVDFVPEICPKLSKPPYVCNSCTNKHRCTLEKKFFNSKVAFETISTRKSESRKGFNITAEHIEHINSILNIGVKLHKQSIHHVYTTYEDTIMVSERTIYNMIEAGVFDIKNIDLINKVKMRPRKNNKSTHKVDRKCKEGRTYEDFLAYLEENPDTEIVEMDSVIGKKGESETLLTLHFRTSSFMLAFLRKRNDSRSVTTIFNELYIKLGAETFKNLFPVILTDNGSEFSNPTAIEFDQNGEQRTRIFYCHPSCPHEKGSCEVNHELIRRVLPKGKSLKHITQESVDLMMSHINSYKRKKLNNSSSLESFSYLYGDEIPTLFNITKIEAQDVHIAEDLVKQL